MKQIIAFTGLPGTGKSTLAEALATETGVPAFAGDWLLGALRPHGAEYNGRLRVVECVCRDEGEHRRRLDGRRRGIPGWHEVGWDHVVRMRSEYPQLAGDRLVVDAMDPLDMNLDRVRAYLRRW